MPSPDFEAYQRQLDELRNKYAQQRSAPIAPRRSIQSCDGIRAAKAYQETLAPGSSDIVMDSNSDTFYVVMKDENGKSPELMTIGHFTLEQEEPPESIYITKKDFAAFEERIMKLLDKENADEQSS